MILPDKYISTETALLGAGAVILRHLQVSRSVTGLWEKTKDEPAVANFERFILAIDLLYALGGVHMHEGLLTRGPSANGQEAMR